MEDSYKWPPFISSKKQAHIKRELNRIIKDDFVRCNCGSLAIRVHTYKLDTHFKVELQCKCGTADRWGFLEGKIPAMEGTMRKDKERRSGKDLRSAIDRRKFRDPKVPSTRSGQDRRSGKDRRKSRD